MPSTLTAMSDDGTDALLAWSTGDLATKIARDAPTRTRSYCGCWLCASLPARTRARTRST
jgi:hypothetical protein